MDKSNQENEVEILSEAINEISNIVFNKKCNPQGWKKIQEIVKEIDFELGY